MGVDRSSPLPLWAQIHDELRARIGLGEFEERFPTDEELSASYGVSRQTVREALRHLTSEGLVVRRRGRGTSLSGPVLEQPLHSLYSLATTLREQGLEEHSDILAFEKVMPSPAARRALDLGANESVLYVERLRCAGAEPIAWDRSSLPYHRVAALAESDLAESGLYGALARCCGLRITGGSERIQPVIPDAASRRRLAMSARQAAFAIERLALVGSEPVEFRQTLIRGDRYCLLAQWPTGTSERGEPDQRLREPA
jgi:GntR family transcriptional regulator